MTSVAKNFLFFPCFFLINRKTFKRYTLSESFSFFYLIEKWRRKVRRLSFRDADVVPFTFDLDFPEGLSCRESTVDESGGKTVPYRPWK